MMGVVYSSFWVCFFLLVFFLGVVFFVVSCFLSSAFLVVVVFLVGFSSFFCWYCFSASFISGVAVSGVMLYIVLPSFTISSFFVAFSIITIFDSLHYFPFFGLFS